MAGKTVKSPKKMLDFSCVPSYQSPFIVDLPIDYPNHGFPMKKPPFSRDLTRQSDHAWIRRLISGVHLKGSTPG